MATPQMLTASTGPQQSDNGNSAFLFQLLAQMMQSQMGGQQQLDPNIAAIMSGNQNIAAQAINANDPGRGRLRNAESNSNIDKPGTPGLDNLYAMNPYSVRGQVDWDGSLTANRAQAAGQLKDSNSALLQSQTGLEQAKVDALMRLLGQGGVPNAQGGVDMPQQQQQGGAGYGFNPADTTGANGVPFMLQPQEQKSRMAGPGDMPFIGGQQSNQSPIAQQQQNPQGQTNQPQLGFQDQLNALGIPFMNQPPPMSNPVDWNAVDQIGAPWPQKQQVPIQDIPGMQDWSNMQQKQQVPMQDIPGIPGMPNAPYPNPQFNTNFGSPPIENQEAFMPTNPAFVQPPPLPRFEQKIGQYNPIPDQQEFFPTDRLALQPLPINPDWTRNPPIGNSGQAFFPTPKQFNPVTSFSPQVGGKPVPQFDYIPRAKYPVQGNKTAKR